MNAFDLLKTEREFIFNIAGGLGIMGQLDMIVVTVFLPGYAQAQMPVHTPSLPFLIPFIFSSGTDEELHFHLFELAHAEDELPGHDLVAEGLADLGDAKGDLHAARFLDIQKVDEDTLGRLGTQVDLAGLFGDAAQLGREHEVELAYIR